MGVALGLGFSRVVRQDLLLFLGIAVMTFSSVLLGFWSSLRK